MAEVLNIDRLHRNGRAEIEVGIRNTGFVIKRDENTDNIIIHDLKNDKILEINPENAILNNDTINNLHYYCNKDIVIKKNLFIIEEFILNIKCSDITDGKLVIPYDLEVYSSINVSNPENVNKIIIPRGINLVNDNKPMTDEDLVEIFTNLKVIVRIHEDGAVLSYNIETAELN